MRANRPWTFARERLDLRRLLDHVRHRLELARRGTARRRRGSAIRIRCDALDEDAQRPVGHPDHLVDDRAVPIS